MKKSSVFLIAAFLLSMLSYQHLNAQNSDAVKEKDIQMDIEQQKKAMFEQQKAQKESVKVVEENMKVIEKSLQDLNLQISPADINGGDEGDIVRFYHRRGDRSFGFEEPFVSSPSSGDYRSFAYGDNSEGTRWDFTKNVKESTFSNEYKFDVEKTVKSVVMSVNGDCRNGEIRIKISMPNGKVYSDILIDTSGNLNWRKSFSISETENQDKTGEWKYQISADKATGFFRISLQTN